LTEDINGEILKLEKWIAADKETISNIRSEIKNLQFTVKLLKLKRKKQPAIPCLLRTLKHQILNTMFNANVVTKYFHVRRKT
jgi:hypothetical protein